MREPTVDAVLAALKTHGSAVIAAAIYADNDPAFIERLVDALTTATTQLAAYPRAEVIAEADALLYQTLCDPIADAVPTAFTGSNTECSDGHRDTRLSSPMLERLRRTDADAARRLVASGLEEWWTIEQYQVATCIRELLDTGVTPTRASVVAHATMRARHAMRPHEGTEPFAHSPDPRLGPRILSSSPVALVPGWVRRLDASPPLVDLAQNRIAYLQEAMRAMGDAAVAADRLARIPLPRSEPPPAPRSPTPALSLSLSLS